MNLRLRSLVLAIALGVAGCGELNNSQPAPSTDPIARGTTPAALTFVPTSSIPAGLGAQVVVSGTDQPLELSSDDPTNISFATLPNGQLQVKTSLSTRQGEHVITARAAGQTVSGVITVIPGPGN